MAESLGFEPKDGYKPSHDFQSCVTGQEKHAPGPLTGQGGVLHRGQL